MLQIIQSAPRLLSEPSQLRHDALYILRAWLRLLRRRNILLPLTLVLLWRKLLLSVLSRLLLLLLWLLDISQHTQNASKVNLAILLRRLLLRN